MPKKPISEISPNPFGRDETAKEHTKDTPESYRSKRRAPRVLSDEEKSDFGFIRALRNSPSRFFKDMDSLRDLRFLNRMSVGKPVFPTIEVFAPDNIIAALEKTKGAKQLAVKLKGLVRKSVNPIKPAIPESIARQIAAKLPDLPIANKLKDTLADIDQLNKLGIHNEADLKEALDEYREGRDAREEPTATEEGPRFSRSPKTESEAFKRWFGSSKVVDKQGEPLVVYHGTMEDFSAFSQKRTGSRTGNKYGKEAIFFTSNPRAASDYAATSMDMESINPLDAPNVIPAFLSLQNPLEIDAQGQGWGAIDNQIRQAQRQGRDGVIVRHVLDHANAVTAVEEGPIDVYVVFSPEQVKSAIGNQGTFNPENPDIRLSRTKTQGISKAGLVEHASGLMRAWRNRPPVEVVSRFDELPKAIQKRALEASDGSDVDGVYWKGKVYLVAENIKNLKQAENAIFHEVLGHYGLRKTLGDKLNPLLNQVYLAYGKPGLEDIAKRYGLDLDTREGKLEAAEEKLAHMAQNNQKPGILKKLYAINKRLAAGDGL